MTDSWGWPTTAAELTDLIDGRIRLALNRAQLVTHDLAPSSLAGTESVEARAGAGLPPVTSPGAATP